MTIDPETKNYIDTMVKQLSINTSALITAITSTLEDKGIFTRQDFDGLVDRSRIIRNQAAILTSSGDFKTALSKLEELMDKLNKEGMDRKNWEDLK